MKFIYLTLNWLFGIIFLLLGFLTLFTSVFAGLSLLVVSLMLLPPIRNYAYSKSQREIPTKTRAIAISVLIILFFVFVVQAQRAQERLLEAEKAEERAEQAAQAKQEKIDYFHANRNSILSSLRSEFEEGNFGSVVEQSDKYLLTEDAQLIELNNKASAKIAAIKRKQRTNELLTELKSLPVEEYEENLQLYEELLKLHPNNKQYMNKVDFYQDKIDQREQKEALAKAREQRIQEQFSPWDGSHRRLESFIQRAMNDPDSYEHVETVYWDKGDYLIVETTFRGKNAFGGGRKELCSCESNS
jgi:tetratricopeptide (TPR) repeat protein